MPTLTYIGHSAFVLKDDDGHVVAIDPFITGNPVATIPASHVKPTTILITHAHNDHVGDALDLARQHGRGDGCDHAPPTGAATSAAQRSATRRQPPLDSRTYIVVPAPP
mgnify:CR=1 FL=1